MKNCIIFCAGGFAGLIAPIEQDSYVIAADGGLSHTQSLGVTPDLILGDFDSLGYTPENATVYPVEKDDTDAMLAVRQGLNMGFDRFFLYGTLDGPRIDHTVANIQTLQFLADRGATGYLIGTTQIATLLQQGSLHFPAGCSGTVSVFCLGNDAENVTLKGLHYPLEKGRLTAGFPLGVSNHFTGKGATISVEKGTLLVIYDRCAGFPEEGAYEA